MTANLLPDDIVEQGRTLHDDEDAASWRKADWLVAVIDEFPHVERGRAIWQCATAWGDNPGTLSNKERTARAWPEALRAQYPLGLSMLTLCIRDGEAWEDLAAWALDNNASWQVLSDEKQRRLTGVAPVLRALAGLITRVAGMLNTLDAVRRAKAEAGIALIREALG